MAEMGRTQTGLFWGGVRSVERQTEEEELAKEGDSKELVEKEKNSPPLPFRPKREKAKILPLFFPLPL